MIQLTPGSNYALIDVRSETEFQKTAVPGFISLPLLFQDERSQVGLCYKNAGQQEAIDLGHQLVDPHRMDRVQAWVDCIQASASQYGMIMCWRGGLRSQIATQWIREAGFDAEQIPGGYKKIRQDLLYQLQNPPPLVVISGLTGSGKTELLREFIGYHADLEMLARHRGSAFGGMLEPQPKQTCFENALALALGQRLIILEDESRLLGCLSIPENFYQAMQRAPVVHLEVPIEERVQRIFAEYVRLPLALGMSFPALESNLLTNLAKLRKRLDKYYPQIHEQLKKALAQGAEAQDHQPWIEALLVHYYDRLYDFSKQRNPRMTAWSGDRSSCRDWLKERIADSC